MWLYVILIVSTIVFFLTKKNSSYWKTLGIPGPSPWPLFGNIGPNILGFKHITEVYADIYSHYKKYAFVGFYRGEIPCILVRDPEIIRNVVIKDFKYFHNNDVFLDRDIDPLLARNSFVLKDEEWKKSRQELIPVFSSAKIKSIFPLIEDVSKRFVKYLEQQIASPSSGRCIDAKDVCSKFTCDNIAVCGLGLEGMSFENPNAEFLQVSKNMISTDGLQGIKFGLTLAFPQLTKLFSMKVLPKHAEEQLMKIVSDTIEYRRKHKVVRNDFFDFVSHSSAEDVDLVEVAAHLANFIVDGYETSSSAMASTLLELAMNPECQEKAKNEIDSVIKSDNGIFSYESLQKMTYLDACISEALRKHPQLASLNRTCTETYKMETTSLEYERLSVDIQPGTPVIIPVLGLHMDPRHFPEPDKFIPERFMEKEHIHKYSYLPFGDGPRSCLGQRFGLIQLKIGLAQLLRNFKFTLNEKTRLPIKYSAYYLLLFPRGGIWLDVQKV